MGFTQALLMSGTRSVCLSLWKVNDRATSLLMTRFYQNLLGRRGAVEGDAQGRGAARGEAVAAKLDGGPDRWGAGRASAWGIAAAGEGRGDDFTWKWCIRPQPNRAALGRMTIPYYWAAFVLVGDPD